MKHLSMPLQRTKALETQDCLQIVMYYKVADGISYEAFQNNIAFQTKTRQRKNNFSRSKLSHIILILALILKQKYNV